MASVFKVFGCYFGGGALVVGGPLAGGLLITRGRQEHADYAHERNAESLTRALRTRMSLAELCEEARARGVDPDQVEQALRDLRDGPSPSSN